MPPSVTEPYRRLEIWLAASLVVLRGFVLWRTWGRAQGFDAPHWLAVMHATHWFEPLPLPRALIASYHPPLSYLLGRSIYDIFHRDVEASQLLSTLSIVGAFFALRSALRYIGYLGTLPGLILLYGGFSIPLIVWLGIETGYDALVFFWFMLAFAQSTRLFWNPPPDKWWTSPRYSFGAALLGLTLAAGMLTKFNSLIAMAVPFLFVFVRHGIKSWRRDIGPPLFALSVSVAVIAPLYHHRYVNAAGHREPAAMDWQRPIDLAVARAARDTAPLRFIVNMLRVPDRSMLDSQYPVVDSFFNSIWLHTWKRDGCLGLQRPPSIQVSNLYIVAFPLPLLAGTAWFLLRRRHIADAWRHVGWVLLAIAAIFCASALTFAWGYPLWDWRVFKGKYLTPALLWIAYSVGVCFADDRGCSMRPALRAWVARLALSLLLVFAVINHVMPVY